MRKFFSTLLLAVLLLPLAGCGNNSTNVTSGNFNGGTGTVVVLATDSPRCDVTSFRTTITSLTLTPQSGGTPVSVIASSSQVTLDWASLRDFNALIANAGIPAGTYNTLSLTLSNPELIAADYTAIPPSASSIAVTLSSSTLEIALSPVLSVPADGTAAVTVDFNLLNSLGTDSTTGALTGKVTPSFTATPVALSTFGRLQNLHGLVQSFSTTASGSFTGSLVVSNGVSPAGVSVNVTDSTVLNGVASLGEILLGTFVEIDASVDSSGNIVASSITAEDQENIATQRAAFIGQITSVTRLGTGAVSDFTMIVREEFPDVSADIPLDSSQAVTVLSNTNFNVSAPSANHASVPFDATALTVGQEVVVHGQFLPGSLGVPPTVTTASIYLPLQTIVGNFSSVLVAGTDNKTGGFAFIPCSGSFQGATLAALTASSTGFNGITGLGDLTTTPTLFVRGLVFFAPTQTSIGTVTLSPPQTVLVANSVHKLP